MSITKYYIQGEMLVVGMGNINTKYIPISQITKISYGTNSAHAWRTKRNYAFTISKNKKIELYYTLEGKEDCVVLSPKHIPELVSELKKINPKIQSFVE